MATQPTSELSDEEVEILHGVVEDEDQAVAEAQDTIERVLKQRQERDDEPYPPTTMTQAVALPVSEEEDDEFALPGEKAPGDQTTGVTEDDVKETTRDPYEGQIPGMIITAEVQKAMLRSRLVIGHTFECIEVTGSQSTAKNMLELLQREHPEVYADIVVRVAMAHFICWQKGMGL